MGLTPQQHEQLLKPLNSTRVAKRSLKTGKSLSYLEAWDVRAHLIRIFGFGGWSADTLEAVQVYEDNESGKWSVGWKVTLRLTIHMYPFQPSYTESAIGFSTQGARGEANDMALKTAASDALKRAAMNLGTQFGLSLYDDGATRDVVMKTLVGPDTDFLVAEGADFMSRLGAIDITNEETPDA